MFGFRLLGSFFFPGFTLGVFEAGPPRGVIAEFIDGFRISVSGCMGYAESPMQ